MSIHRNGKLVTGIAASCEPCGYCGCPRFVHKNGRGACDRGPGSHDIHDPDDYTAKYRECSRWRRRRA